MDCQEEAEGKEELKALFFFPSSNPTRSRLACMCPYVRTHPCPLPPPSKPLCPKGPPWFVSHTKLYGTVIRGKCTFFCP